MLGDHKAVKLASLVNNSNSHLATPDALDILSKMMQYDHVNPPLKRIYAQLLSNACVTPTLTMSASLISQFDPTLGPPTFMNHPLFILIL